MRLDTTKLHWLIIATLLINAAAMLSPIINEGDSVTYAALSKHIANNSDWVNLILDGRDWLDKPHFPFWITALSFKIFGVSAFSYILPGFLFHLIGGYFTYRIARQFYDRRAALLSLLVYVSAYHLMYTSSDIKAEAFLTGSITGACYYWLRFDAESRLKHLLLGALLSAIAVMTKGVFTLITITSGLVCMWLFQGQWKRLWHGKWLLATGLTLLFMGPELWALYLQFDAHPENQVFGQTHVSGIKFFLWDSQFGRFFNFGPIQKVEGSPFYYLHVFLWAFLPWVAVFLAAIYKAVRSLPAQDTKHRAAFAFLFGSFVVTFAMFSATTFQIDYYTVIIYPFAAVMCGHYLNSIFENDQHSLGLPLAQMGIAVLVLSMALGIAVYVARPVLLFTAGMFFCVAVLLAYGLRKNRKVFSILVLPVLSINAMYAVVELSAFSAHSSYSIPYNAQNYISDARRLPIYLYQLDTINAQELCVYKNTECFSIGGPSQLPRAPSEYYLIARTADFAGFSKEVASFDVVAEKQWVDHKTGLLPRVLRIAKGVEPMEAISVIKVHAGS